MRGDETQRAVAPGAESRVKKGPRHAAPRKSLLTKLQIPAGKALALAAMPTAVIVGMGMAPKLALADDKDIPFAPGPCVTRSDEPVESESPSPSASKSPEAEPSPGVTPTATPTPGESGKPEPDRPGPSPSASASNSPEAEKPPAPEKPTADKPTAEVRDPLDPLGVGDRIKDFFDELGRPLTRTPEPAGDGEKAGGKAGDEEKAGEEKEARQPERTPEPDPTADAIREAARKAGARTEELADEVKKTETEPRDETGRDKAEEKEEEADEDGKKPFPCPTPDPEALANAELETGVPLLPDDPWLLDSSLLTLYGLDYHGIVEVKTAGGKIKKVLKFTASSIDIKDLHQTVVDGDDVTHVKARSGSTSTFRDGTVTMYTEELKGNLFGIVPITFSPATPPPLNVPFAFFTGVKLKQAGQFGGTLTVPGLKNWVD